MKHTQKTFFAGLSVMTLALVPIGLVLWVAGDQRNLHLFAWNPTYRYLFFGITALAVLIAVTALISVSRHISRAVPVGIIGLLAGLAGLALTAGFYLYLTPYAQLTDKEPHLALTDRIGEGRTPLPALIWYTEEPRTETLRYGRDPENLEFTLSSQSARQSHVFVLEDASPGSVWHYYIEGMERTGSFPYFPGRQQSISIAIAGDSHIGAGTNSEADTTAILEQASASSDLLIHLGDLVEMGNSDSEHSRYLELSSPFIASVPTIHLMGNHDGWFGGAAYWKQLYSPKQLPSDSSGSQLFRRYALAEDVHLFTLNLEWGIETYTPAQRQWFEDSLSRLDPDDLIIVANHAFYFASSTEYDGVPWYDNQDMIEQFHDLYRQRGVDLVFSGHDHQMEHIAVDGIDYVIIGSLGGKPDKPATFFSAGSQYLTFDHFGFARLEIDAESFRAAFIDVQGRELYSWERLR